MRTRQEIAKQAVDKILHLKKFEILNPDLIDLVVTNALIEMENATFERHLKELSKAFSSRASDA